MATAVTAGKHICLSPSRFRDLVAEGVFKRMPAGKYDLDTIREAYCRHAQKVMQGRAEEGGKALSTQRARLADAQASKVEFLNAQMRGGFVELSVLQTYLGRMFGVMKEIALGTPGKISDGLQPHTPKDREAIYEIVKSEIYEMLNNLSDPETVGAAVASKKAKEEQPKKATEEQP